MAELTTEQLRLFEELHNSKLNDFRILNKKDYRGVWNSVVDKYPESAHFVYELLQNADDARASEAYIILQKDLLIFKHNGTKHFDITKENAEHVGDINSITGIGDSSKIGTQNAIGKFGVGFKSVFQYTDTPEIYDDYFKFKIENYIVPTLLDKDHPNRKEGETLFVLPFKKQAESFKEIADRLNKLQNPLLFLRNLNRLVWRIQDGANNEETAENEYSMELLDRVEYANDSLVFEHYRLIEAKERRNIFLLTQEIEIDDNSSRRNLHNISIGYFYDSDNKKLVTDKEQKIFCFFPTKETFKTCFISHAPFLLTDNRQNLKPSERLNDYFVNQLAKLAVKAIIILRDYKVAPDVNLINENITELIPIYERFQGDDAFQKPLIDAFRGLLYRERVLLSRNGKYISEQEAYIGTPHELVDLINQEQLVLLQAKRLENNQTKRDNLFDVKNIDFLNWELSQRIKNRGNDIFSGVVDYSSRQFAADIDAEFMSKQEPKWVVRMYSFLMKDAPKLWKIQEYNKNQTWSNLPFRRSPIIKTQKGEWVRPFENDNTPNVYLPLKEDKNSCYNFVAKEYVDNEIANRFFIELEIKEPNEKDYIRKEILKKYKDGEGLDYDELKIDFEIIFRYYQKVKANKDDCKEFLCLLKDKLRLLACDDSLQQPKRLYFFNENLEKYFDDRSKCRFINLDLYSSCIGENEVSGLRDFFSNLGVNTKPMIEKLVAGEIKNSDRIWVQISSLVNKIRPMEDFELDGFHSFCDREVIDKDVSLYLWNEVLLSCKFDNYKYLTFEFAQKYSRNFNISQIDSTFKLLLTNNKWLIDKNGKRVSAKDIVLEDLDTAYVRDDNIVKFLGIGKRYKSIIELGGTEEQQECFEIGKQFKELFGGGSTLSQMQLLMPQLKHVINSSLINCNSSNRVKDDSDADKTDYFEREELRPTSSTDTFVNTVQTKPAAANIEVPLTEECEADKVMQELEEQEEKHNEIIRLKQVVNSSEKYTKEWFEALIELEYRVKSEKDSNASTNSLSISFNSVNKEIDSDRIYVFRNPSRIVPYWMEEVEDIEVKCSFSNIADLSLKFEVANVRDNSLRLKASKAYEEVLNKLDWGKCTKATITLKNQIDLTGKLRTAFNKLAFEDGFNLKENLKDNVEFIFGPPGTGKTTTLAKRIANEMEQNSLCRILVLAPTNTACDELVRKIKEYYKGDCSWLHRFVSTADEELEDFVVDRDSSVYEDEKCCLISTIARLSFDGFNVMGENNRLSDIEWNMIICDEASMISLAEISLAIYTFANTPILIAGDPMQIKPILRETEWKDENIYTMVNLDRFDNPKTEPIQFRIENLSTQYRSVPAIGELYSQYAYDGKLEHYRSKLSQDMKFGNLVFKPINFMQFKVEKFDSIFGIKKLDGSNVHIYSAIFVVELYKYIVRECAKDTQEEFSIGIVCPYSPQVQLIESLISQIPNVPINIRVVIGTVHRFQGGQCNLMIVVLNPPLGIKSERNFLNDKNILNVAISRAQDCLCVLLPHKDTNGYEYLYEVNNIGSIATRSLENVSIYTCDQIEELIFGKKFFIENNTFVTSHQLTNVYTKATKLYEVHIDEKSVDVQLGSWNSGVD